MTNEAPRHTWAMISSSTPSAQLVPVTRNIAEAASDPTQAKPAKSLVGWVVRSAIAPTKMRKMAETIVDTVMV